MSREYIVVPYDWYKSLELERVRRETSQNMTITAKDAKKSAEAVKQSIAQAQAATSLAVTSSPPSAATSQPSSTIQGPQMSLSVTETVPEETRDFYVRQNNKIWKTFRDIAFVDEKIKNPYKEGGANQVRSDALRKFIFDESGRTPAPDPFTIYLVGWFKKKKLNRLAAQGRLNPKFANLIFTGELIGSSEDEL